MKKTDDNIIQNEDTEVVVGEVMSQEEASAKTRALLRQDSTKPPFGSYITKSNELIQKTKYSLPRNEQKILFMLLSKIDQKSDLDASKYYTITFQEFSKLTGVNMMRTGYRPHLQQTVEQRVSGGNTNCQSYGDAAIHRVQNGLCCTVCSQRDICMSLFALERLQTRNFAG